MSVFLLTFDRSKHRLVRLEEFPANARLQAEDARFQAELEALRSGEDIEVVTLEADSLDTLKKTHGSYFPETLPLTV